jgi:hypothetical protein
LRELQEETATTEGRAAILAMITELENRGRIDALMADSLRGLINCLVDIDLAGPDARTLIDEVVHDDGKR